MIKIKQKKQLTKLYDFSLFMKTFRYHNGHTLKELAIDLGIEKSKLSRIENAKIPHDEKFEKLYLKLFNISLSQFKESDNFYCNLYNDIIKKSIYLDTKNVFKKIKLTIHDFKKKNNLFSPLEPLILFIAFRLDKQENSKKYINQENEMDEFLNKNLSCYDLTIRKFYLAFKAKKLADDNLYLESYSLIKLIFTEYPMNHSADCILYCWMLKIANYVSFTYPAYEYYSIGRAKCIQISALKGLALLDNNYTNYLRSTNRYADALKIDLNSLQLTKQLKDDDFLERDILFNIGLDYHYLGDNQSAISYYSSCIENVDDEFYYFYMLYSIYMINDHTLFKKTLNKYKKTKPENLYYIEFIEHVVAREQSDLTLASQILDAIYDNFYNQLCNHEKRAFLKYAEDYYQFTKESDLMVKYTEINKNLITQ